MPTGSSGEKRWARRKRAFAHPTRADEAGQQVSADSEQRERRDATPAKAEHTATDWQTAMEALLLAVRGAATMPARIGIMKARHRHARVQAIGEDALGKAQARPRLLIANRNCQTGQPLRCQNAAAAREKAISFNCSGVNMARRIER